MITCSRINYQSSLVLIFKGKEECRGIKLLQHAFKLYEKVLDRHLCEVVDIDKIQYGFMPGRGIVELSLFCGELVKNSEPKIRSCFLYLLTWKRLLIEC